MWAAEHGGVSSGEDGLVDRARRRFRLVADVTAGCRALRTGWLWGAEVLLAYARDSLGQDALGALSPEEVGERVHEVYLLVSRRTRYLRECRDLHIHVDSKDLLYR